MVAFNPMLLSNTVIQDNSSAITDPVSVDGAVDTVSKVAELLNKYGFAIVFMAACLVLIFIGFFYMFRLISINMNKFLIRLEEHDTDVYNQSKDIMDKILDDYFNKKRLDDNIQETKKEEEHKTTLIPGFIYATNAITDASRIAMGEIHADRIAVYVFHNGNNTPFGFPFVKMSCINEFTLKGISTVRGQTHNGLALHAFSNIVECLVNNGEYIVGNIYNHGIINSDNQVLSFVSGSPVKALFAVSIKDDNGDIAAFTVAEFRDGQDFSDYSHYNLVHSALQHMNESIKHIVISDDYLSQFIKNKEGSSN